VNDPTVNNNTFTAFGGATYAQMVARATITVPRELLDAPL